MLPEQKLDALIARHHAVESELATQVPPATYVRLPPEFAELGPVGIALLGVALFVPLAALRRRQEPLVAGTVGAYVAFLLHNAIDWDWKVTALALVGMLCGTATVAATSPSRYSSRYFIVAAPRDRCQRPSRRSCSRRPHPPPEIPDPSTDPDRAAPGRSAPPPPHPPG